MQMKSIARRPFKYGGVLVHPADEFSVKSERDAKVLTVARRAALLAAPPPPPAAAPAPAASKRSYKRRDMVAETAAAPASPVVFTREPIDMPPAPEFQPDLDDMLPQARDDGADADR